MTWRWLAATELTFVALAGLYSLVTPIFEGPDEVWHFAFADHVADGGGLPVLSASNPNILLRNAAHPPLYHALVAAVIAPIDREDFPHAYRFNLASPRVTPGSFSDRPNLFVHTGREDFPYHKTVLAVHLARLVSVALGALTLLGVWQSACLVMPDEPWLPVLAVSLVAYIPQFVFVSGLINNDALAAAAAAWTLVALQHLIGRPWSGARALGAGLCLGTALLSKLGMIALAPLPAVALWLAWRAENSSPGAESHTRTSPLNLPAALRSGAIVYGVALAAAGWWYARNWMLYGDPLAWREWQALAGVGRLPPTVAEFLRDMLGLFGTFWADFNLRADRRHGWHFGVIVVMALIGWARRLNRRVGPDVNHSGWILALTWFGLLLALTVRYSLVISEIHGRLLYPALGTIGLGLALGLAAWAKRLSRGLIGGAVACNLAMTALAPFLLIQPAFSRPVLKSTALPVGVTPASVNFSGQVELVGYRLNGNRVMPGGVLALVTYWRTKATGTHAIPDLRQVVALVRPDGAVIGRAEGVLGTSVYPSSEWQRSEIIVAEVAVPVDDSLDGPAVAMAWLDVRTEAGHLLRTDGGQTVDLGRVIASRDSRNTCTASAPADVRFGGLVRLSGYRIDTQAVTLCWESLSPTSVDYTIFVHVIGQDGTLLDTADSPPRRGNYPTSVWAAGEQVEDTHTVRVPPGARVQVGLYLLDSGERLVRDDTGESEYELRP